MEEEESRLLVQHVAMDSRHVDAIRSQRLDHGIHLIACKNKISGDGCLAITGRLETDSIRHAHRSDRTYLHSILGHRIAARHSKLIDTAVRLPLNANDLIKLRRVEIDRRPRAGRSRSRQRGLARAKRITNNSRHLRRVAMAADMQVERRRAG